jgi:hypothetical protein
MLTERKRKRLLSLSGKKIPDEVLALMTVDALSKYRELKKKANVNVFQLIPMLGVLVLLYSVFVNLQFSYTLGMVGVSGWAISLIIVLMDGMKSYSSYQIGVAMLNKTRIQPLHVFSAITFGLVAVYAFYIVNIGAGLQSENTSNNFKSELSAYTARVAGLKEAIAASVNGKPDETKVKRTDNDLDNVMYKLDALSTKTTWRKGKRIAVMSMLGTPICGKINGAFTRKYCPNYVSLMERKRILTEKMARFNSYKDPVDLRKELSVLLTSPPKKQNEAVKLSLLTVLTLGFLVEFLGMLLILEQQKALSGFHESMLFVDKLRKYNIAQIEKYVSSNSVIEEGTDMSSKTSGNVALTSEAKVIKKFFMQGGYKELRVSDRLQTNHLKALKAYRPIGKKLKGKTESDQLEELVDLLLKYGVTTSGNRGRKLSSLFKSSLRA